MLNDLKLTSVDQLGSLLAEIKTLEARADAIKTQIKEAASAGGPRVIEGLMFKATYSESNRSTVDYKQLCADLNLTAEDLAPYQRTSAVFAVKVTSR